MMFTQLAGQKMSALSGSARRRFVKQHHENSAQRVSSSEEW